MYGINDGEPFQVFVRRQANSPNLVMRFECKEGMGILGIRKAGRTDPSPSAAYEEEEIEPASLRAGRFVHVLASGQRQSYALSRISGEVTTHLPQDSWVELKPQTEYGFRYLVAPGAAAEDSAPRSAGAPPRPPPLPEAEAASPTVMPRRADSSAPAPQAPVSPPLAEAMLARLPKEQAVEYLRSEMARVGELQRRVDELEEQLARSKARERDLIEVIRRWQGS